jgi:hypothetical protein
VLAANRRRVTKSLGAAAGRGGRMATCLERTAHRYAVSSGALGRTPSKICRFARSVSWASRRDNGKPIIAPQRGPVAHSAAAGSAFQSAACWSPETLPSCTKTFHSRHRCQTRKARRWHYISSLMLKTSSRYAEADDVTRSGRQSRLSLVARRRPDGVTGPRPHLKDATCTTTRPPRYLTSWHAS